MGSEGKLRPGVLADEGAAFGLPAGRFEEKSIHDELGPRRIEDASSQIEQGVIEPLAAGEPARRDHLGREQRRAVCNLDVERLDET
jgi:hypothetical protein